ncbi:hypothetical protein AA0117_g1213 [Alternaria alternata]|uniref:Uncharacterized protein n=1 Tax=Alternaria alternata TaxID=5599 RepID=A0A4V1WTI1_ALTAL|nr:hypothetical protein AA0117_g1213 [Alternaria alternata]
MVAQDYVPALVPRAGEIISIMLQISTFGVLSVCIMRRTQFIQKCAALPLAMWLILIIYCDSALFVFATAIVVHGFGINSSPQVCEGGILLCLICYMTTKILIYYFLVEKAYVVRGSMKPRMKTKLWLFNCLFMLLPYTVFVIMNFIFRITYINDSGVCIIGMQKIAMLPLITFEVIVNVYLTALFIIPVRNLYSYKHNANPTLHRMAKRSLIGSLATLTTSVINLTILMVLKGEPGWICLMCCNADILFCVIVLHWVTSKDKQTVTTDPHSGYGNGTIGSRSGTRSDQRRNSKMTYGERTNEKKTEIITIKGISENSQNSNSINSTNASRNNSGSSSRRPSLNVFPTVMSSNPHHRPQTSPRLMPSGVTTECKSSSPTQSRLRAPSRGLYRTPTREEFGDEVELNNIRVETIHTREVEIEDDRRERTESVRSDGEEWVGHERRVVGEGVV